MIEQLSALLEAQVPCDGESMAQVLELFDRAEAKLHAAVLELDASGAWADEGCLDVTGFVSVHGRCSRGYARRLTGRAAKLAALPVLFGAWRDGELSKFQVEVVLANVGRHLGVFASQEAEVVPTLVPLGPAETVAVMMSWRRHADALDEPSDKSEEPSELYLARTMHGRRELAGHLSA
ncbi:MAG TPA: DUF222 domain-containing protein, partial [Acidimicrobiales bacterium]|nr:DUF222 domain-containing protein [Acidimicrobiales bacterium]